MVAAMTNLNDTGDDHTTFDELCEPLNPFLEQHERDHPPHHRETLPFAGFVRKVANAFFIIRAKTNLGYTRVQRLPVNLPRTVQHLFRHVTDQRVRLTNAKGRPIYRLASFYVGQEQYLILTNRLDLTTFQVILLYAYRWQVELIFRFLKRSYRLQTLFLWA